MLQRIAVAGAGFSGAIIANELAKAGYKVEVFESRGHIAGNCFTERDVQSGVLLHRYGPHIFHTDKQHIWEYVNQLTSFKPYINRVKAQVKGQVYSLPINLHTINQFYQRHFNPQQAKEWIDSQADKSIESPQSFEDQAMAFVGESLYEAFFKGYTLKQWGRHPSELPASILKRLPVRFNYDDNYFNHPYQGIPEHGYTPMVEKLLAHKNITLKLATPLQMEQATNYRHIVFTGPIDAYFDYQLGRLSYRTLDFEEIRQTGDFQGCAVMNYCDADIPHTRISEHKHFAPWESHEHTVCYKEFSREAEAEDIPYYPVRLIEEKQLLQDYIALANQQHKVTFVGRLGTYRYLDMDVTIDEALQTAAKLLECLQQQKPIPSFVFSPL